MIEQDATKQTEQGTPGRSPHRIPIVMEYIERFWEKYPEWRLGQLIANLSQIADPENVSVWDVEDVALINATRTALRAAVKAPSISEGKEST